MKPIRFLFFLVLLGAGAGVAVSAEAPGLPSLEVPLGQSSEKRDAALEVVNVVLSDYAGKTGAEPEFLVTQAGLGVLWGDLRRWRGQIFPG